MGKQRLPHSPIDRLRARAAIWGVGGGAAALAIAMALVGLTALFLLVGALGVNSAPETLAAAAQDAAVALYAVQLVGFSFFNETAELRFVAIPGLLLVGLAVAAAAALAVRAYPGSARRKMSVALAMPVAYALLLGTAALFVPLSFTAPGVGVGIAVEPSPRESFLLPLVWGLLFASIGGLVGIHGRNWRQASADRLGAWATPTAASLRVLAAALAASATLVLAGAVALTGGDLSWVTDGGFGHAAKVLGGALLVLPTLAASVLLSGFGVSFDWQLDVLAHGEGSISAFGGPLPAGSEDLREARGVPGLFALAPVVAIGMVFAIGWISARRSGLNARLGLINAVRAATVVTLAVWLLALLARVEAQAGGLLGFQLVPDAGALLWRVPLVALLGALAGSFAYALAQGPFARRRLAAGLLAAVRPSNWGRGPNGPNRPEWVSRGLTWRAALGVSFAVVPVLLVGMGATGTPTSAAPEDVSMAPITREAEQVLEEDSAKDESVAVTVNPETRTVGTASVDTTMRSLGIKPGATRPAKAEDVLERYGELFGLDDPASELGNPQSSTDDLGVTHVTFTQAKDGLPVFGGGIGVHLSQKGERLDFISGSVIPDVALTDPEPQLTRAEAIMVGKRALPDGTLAGQPRLQIYAGMTPYISGPNARIAWFVEMTDDDKHVAEEYVVDAVTGEVLDTIEKIHHVKERYVYHWQEGPNLPGELWRQEEEEEETGDPDVDAAYENTGRAYDFFEKVAERDSWDGEGAPVKSTVHFREPSGATFENAYWDGGNELLVFGDGFPQSVDVVGHEFTHAVTEGTSELLPKGQAGALNESFSDIVGELIEWEKSEEVDWEMGSGVPSGRFRSLKEPNDFNSMAGAGISDPDPKHLSEWIETCLDNFGIHANSTITSHAFYLAAQTLGGEAEMDPIEVGELFIAGWTQYLKGVPNPTLQDARAATLAAVTAKWGEESVQYTAVKGAFEEVGLDGVTQPTLEDCGIECSFQGALYKHQSVDAGDAVEMLSTLYKARGELAMTSVAGEYFLPLYEEHMERITELVMQDPVLAEMTVDGLEEVTPALEGLIEGRGEKFDLGSEQMEKIEAALRRLAEDDRLYAGEDAGELADLIEDELQWMSLPSYGGMNYESGFERLNGEVEAQTMMLETGELIEPNCTGQPYSNDFHVNGFYADSPGTEIPGQVAPLEAGGIICGTLIEETAGKSGCVGEESLNSEVSVQLPPGSKVNSSKNLPSKSWVGKVFGRAFACAGNETQLIYGEAGLLSLSSWSGSQCPTEAIACYEGKSTFKNGEGSVTGKGYAWVTEEGGAFTLTTRPVTVSTENGYFATVGFGQFRVELCGRAGSSGTKTCGGTTAGWIHRNGEAADLGCPGGKGRYYMQATNAGEETTVPVSTCQRWTDEAQMKTVNAPNSFTAVNCVPSSTTCVATDNNGNAFYSTNVSPSAATAWSSWTGPGTSPSHDVACPSSTLCVLAAGSVSGGGGNVYRASSLGGSFLTSFTPANGVGALSCPTTTFCVSAQEGGGFIRYSVKPSGTLWSAVAIGTGAMKDVACLSSSFCAVVDGSGNVRVAVTEKGVKEAVGWTTTNVNGATALQAVACSSTSSCLATDSSSKVIKMAIAGGGGATASSATISGAGKLNDVACVGSTCVLVDDAGGIFASENSGTSWEKRFNTGTELKSVSCASSGLCTAVAGDGDLVQFDPVA